ncbi:MAG TPA: DMT family protein [Candidatus Acidoferrales bacterium]
MLANFALHASTQYKSTFDLEAALPKHLHARKFRGSMLRMTTIVLLTISNIFMTFAWYGHLKYRQAPLFKVILISWVIAFAEYCFQVPANRIGSYEFNVVQLKTIQEVITLTVFSIFSVLYLGTELKWNYFLGFALMVAAVSVIFKKW